MTREQFSALIHWPAVAWVICVVGIFTMVPQLVQIIRTRQVRDVNLTMFIVAFITQSAYAAQGFFIRDVMLLLCMAVAALITFVIIVLIVVWR